MMRLSASRRHEIKGLRDFRPVLQCDDPGIATGHAILYSESCIFWP
jgi:hypothetical protein